MKTETENDPILRACFEYRSVPEQLAHDHWNWLGPLLQKIYVDAFVHGYKHGEEDNEHN